MVEKSLAFDNVMIWLGENWLKHLKREASRDFAMSHHLKNSIVKSITIKRCLILSPSESWLGGF